MAEFAQDERSGQEADAGRLIAVTLAELISNTGTQMSWVALPWLVLTATGSAAQMTGVIIADLAPIALLGVIGGGLVDRVGVRKAMLAGDAIRFPLTAAIPVLAAFRLLPYWLLLVLVFAIGVFSAPYFGAQRSVVSELAGDSPKAVGRGQALIQASTRLTAVAGPALAGFLIGLLSPLSVLWIDAATYLVSFGILAVALPRTAPRMNTRPGWMDGLRAIRKSPFLTRALPSKVVRETVFQVMLAVIPFLVLTRWGKQPALVGLLLAVWAAGSLAGNLLAGALAQDRLRVGRLSMAVALQALLLWPLALSSVEAVAMAAMAASGIANGLTGPPMSTLITMAAPAGGRSQVFATWLAVGKIASVAGLAIAGPLMASAGATAVLVVLAVVGCVEAAYFSLFVAPAAIAQAEPSPAGGAISEP